MNQLFSRSFMLPDDAQLLGLVDLLGTWPVPWTFRYDARNFLFARGGQRMRVQITADGTLMNADADHVVRSNNAFDPDSTGGGSFGEQCILREPYDGAAPPTRISFGCPGAMCTHTAVELNDAVVARVREFVPVYRGDGRLATRTGMTHVDIAASDHHPLGTHRADLRWIVSAWADSSLGGHPEQLQGLLARYQGYPSIHAKSPRHAR